MAFDRSKYPANWHTEIRPAILARAENRCELCGAENYDYGYRGKDGKWFSSEYIHEQLEKYGIDLFEEFEALDHCFDKKLNPTKPTKIVLTIAHWYDKDPMNCELGNLKAACQYCHLRHDSDQHQTSARITREKKAGLQRMF